jgi:hypothetical protein
LVLDVEYKYSLYLLTNRYYHGEETKENKNKQVLEVSLQQQATPLYSGYCGIGCNLLQFKRKSFS